MKTENIIFTSLITLATVSWAGVVSAAALFSDDYTKGQGVTVQPLGVTVYSDSGVTTAVPSGSRDVRLDVNNTASQSASAGATDFGGGIGTFSGGTTNSNLTSYENVFRIRYDGSASTLGTTGDALNLSAGPFPTAPGTFSSVLDLRTQPLFQIGLENYQFRNATGKPVSDAFIQFYVTFYNATAGTNNTVSSNKISGVDNGPGFVELNFSSWGATNLSAVSAIDLTIVARQSSNGVSQRSTDFALNLVQTTVPFEFSPTMGIGLLGMAWGANRLRKFYKSNNAIKAIAV